MNNPNRFRLRDLEPALFVAFLLVLFILVPA